MDEVTGSQGYPQHTCGAVLGSTMPGHMLNRVDGRFQSELVPTAEKAGYQS